jgi:DNA polymerase I
VNDSGKSFRTERYPQYKATRQKLSDDLQQDFDRGMERIRAILAANHVPVITLDGYEADDVIGTLAEQGISQGLSVVVVSGDKDFQQLVRPGLWLLNPGRGGPAGVEENWVSLENAEERLGVPPHRVTDYLAMVGDTSDNVPGVPGIGEKTARELVQAYGPIESILEHAAEVTKKRPREALQQFGQQAILSKELVTIRHDLPVNLDLESIRVRPPDTDRLRDLYVELEFLTLARDMGAPAVEKKSRFETNYKTAATVEEVAEVIARVRKIGHFSMGVEAVVEPGSPVSTDPLRSTPAGLAIVVTAGEGYYLPFGHRTAESEENGGQTELRSGLAGDSIGARAIAASGREPVRNLPPLDSPSMRPLRELLEDPGVRKTAHDAKFDILVLRRLGVRLAGVDFDTMVASYVLDPGRRSHALDVLGMEFLDHTITSHEALCGKGKAQLPYEMIPVDCARDYACEKADVALRLRGVFEPELAQHELTQLFRDIEIPLVSVLADMEWMGVAIDVEWFRSLKERFQRERERVEQEIYAVAGEEFNINSNPKLRQILFEKLKLPIGKRTASGPSTDATVLQELAESGHALPELMLEYRELFKLEGTYLDALPALVLPSDGRLHTSFNQTVASTGRLSSSDPNLQNIPIRRDLGRDIRRGFIPRPEWMLLAADYSQIELRLLAHLSGDPAFVNAFRAGGDIHRQTASIIFGVDVQDVTPAMRARAKTINFATIYGQGPHALSRQLKIEHAEARAFIATYFARFEGVRAFLDASVEQARQRGYVQTLFGRRRYIPELKDRNFNVRAFGERTAQNSPIQGSAADLIKIAMIRLADRLRSERFAAAMLLQVHDELVFEVPPEELDALRALVIAEMTQAATLSVPLVVDVGIGRDWVETKH